MGKQDQTYRIVQWATGNIGRGAMKAIIEHPQMTLVGVHVHNDAKVGVDAGDLCDLGRKIGVEATRDVEQIVALRPDCVAYAPQSLNLDDVCRLLESGANVVTSLVEFHHAASLSPEVRSRVEDACRRGGSSLYATGGSPGFITEQLPLVLCNLQRRLDRLTIDEFANMSGRVSKGLIFDVMGWGKKPTALADEQVQHASAAFGESFRQLADTISMPLDRIEAEGQYGTTRKRLEIAAGVLEAGTAAATRVSATGYRGDHPLMRFNATWYGTTDLEQDWDLRPNGWRVQVEGDASLDISIGFVASPEEFSSYSKGLTAHPVVNAIPAVCEASPGIKITSELKLFPNLG